MSLIGEQDSQWSLVMIADESFYACNRCGSLVSPSAGLMETHTNWHAMQDMQDSELGKLINRPDSWTRYG